MYMKKCNKCKRKKSLDKFSKDKSRLDNINPICKKCIALKCKKWYIKNRLDVIKKQRQYSKSHKLEIKDYRKKNFNYRSKYMRKWRLKNHTHILTYKNKYEQTRKKSDVGYKMLCNLRNRIIIAMKNNSKCSSTKELLGCSIEDLKSYLQSKFITGMTWENYGRLGWHIDHIRPCSSYDLSDPIQQQQCFHFTNLQPLWHIDNVRKSDKIIV